MDYSELKESLSYLHFQLFHEVHDNNDYYFCFLRKSSIPSGLINLMQKHQSINVDEFRSFCHFRTVDIIEMAEDPENDAFIYFVDILNITDKNYIQQSLFLYKHISNIICFKFFNSYFDEKTFKYDLALVLDDKKEFKYIKKGKVSPSGEEIELGIYDMNNLRSKDYEQRIKQNNANVQEIEELFNNFGVKNTNPNDALNEIYKKKSNPVLEKQFNISDFERIGLKQDKDLADKFFEKLDNTTSLLGDVVLETTSVIKDKIIKNAPIVQENAKIVSKVVSKKLRQAVQQGAQIVDSKIKEQKYKKLKNDDLFSLDILTNEDSIKKESQIKRKRK